MRRFLTAFPTFIAETKRAVKQIQWLRFSNREEKERRRRQEVADLANATN